MCVSALKWEYRQDVREFPDEDASSTTMRLSASKENLHAVHYL